MIRFLARFVLVCVAFAGLSEQKLCSRMYFHHGNEDSMPYVQLEGVYKRYNQTSNRPIYKHEQRDYFFEYNITTNFMYFSRMLNGKRSYIGVKAQMSDLYKRNNWEHLDKKPGFPFYHFTKRWWFYTGNTHLAVRGNTTYFKCVPNDFYKCSTGRLFFDHTLGLNGVKVNEKTKENFNILPDTFVNNRRVYKHNKKSDWYLFYKSSGHWVVGSDYKFPGFSKIFMKVYDSPIRPEYISRAWLRKNGTTWANFSKPVGLKCSGITQQHGNGTIIRCREKNPCAHKTKCIDNVLQETVCQCPDDLQGLNCSRYVESCSTYSPGSKVRHYHSYGSKVGDFVTVFCNKSYSPDFYLEQCQSSEYFGPSWSGSYCSKKLNPTSSTGSEKPFDSDNDSEYSDFLLKWGFFIGIPLVPIVCAIIEHRVFTLRFQFRVTSIYTSFAMFFFWMIVFWVCKRILSSVRGIARP